MRNRSRSVTPILQTPSPLLRISSSSAPVRCLPSSMRLRFPSSSSHTHTTNGFIQRSMSVSQTSHRHHPCASSAASILTTSCACQVLLPAGVECSHSSNTSNLIVESAMLSLDLSIKMRARKSASATVHPVKGRALSKSTKRR